MERRLTINSEVRSNEPEKQSEQDNKQPKKLSGYAIMWNTPSKDLGGFTEIVDPKALDGVDLSKVLMLSDHDYSKVLASVKAGTLTLKPDEKGLYFEATLPDTTTANDVFSNVKAGNLDSCSFGFDLDDGADEWSKDDQGNITRKINQIKDLFDVSVVAIPAYDGTSVTADEDKNIQIDKRSYNEFLNKEGIKNMNKTIIDPAETEKTEIRSFENYIRSRGEKRDGLTSDGANIVIPEQVSQPVIEELSNNDLAKYSYDLTVSSSMGKIPVISDTQAVLATKAELAEIQENESGIDGIKYEVQTRAGKIILSNELLEDSAVDLPSIISDQLKRLVLNTNNSQISKILNGLPDISVTTMDDIIKAYDGSLDPNFKEVAITNMTGLAYLNTLKYEDGHFMLMDDLTSPSGKSIFGLPLIVINDKFLSGTPLFIGSLHESVAVITRNNIEIKYSLWDDFGTAFAAVLRSDYQLLNKEAMLNLTLPVQQPAK